MGSREAAGGAGRESRAVPRRILRCLPREPGVYRFRDARGQVLYVGRAASVRARVGAYWSDLQDRRQLAPMVARIRRVEVVLCDSEHEAWWLERNLLEQHLPRFNRTPGGQEVPTYVVFHQAGPAPRLTVTPFPRGSAGTVSFGPFLGAARVRSAVAGLHRVLPLGFTDSSGDRSARELATARGVHVGDLLDLTDTVTAVLRGDQDAVAAVRARLLAKRDQAVTRLAFEVAGHIQSELDGLAWTVSPQKVNRPDTGDATINGWADGVLVRFEIRAGRLTHWTQRHQSRPPATRRPDAHTAQLRSFAERNAQLAARLIAAGTDTASTRPPPSSRDVFARATAARRPHRASP
jgi:excinuclease ABC subunit C